MIFLNKKLKSEEVVFEKPGLKIVMYKHPETVEASKPDWGIFNEHFSDITYDGNRKYTVGRYVKP